MQTQKVLKMQKEKAARSKLPAVDKVKYVGFSEHSAYHIANSLTV